MLFKSGQSVEPTTGIDSAKGLEVQSPWLFTNHGFFYGVALIDFGGTTDAPFGLALSPDLTKAVAVGWKGVPATESTLSEKLKDAVRSSRLVRTCSSPGTPTFSAWNQAPYHHLMVWLSRERDT